MRNGNEFVTPFWKNALGSLPKPLQERYALQLHAAERWELAFGALFQSLSQARDALARLFHLPSSAH
jgi:hypothetical protein